MPVRLQAPAMLMKPRQATAAGWQVSRRDLYADGFDPCLTPEERASATTSIAFGKATWPHMLARAMLVEQLYRATSIIAGHPYHRE